MGDCAPDVWDDVCGRAVWRELWGSCFIHILIGFIHGSVQHFTLWHVPVNVLLRLYLWFSQVKHFECLYVKPPEVQCVHLYSVAGT